MSVFRSVGPFTANSESAFPEGKCCAKIRSPKLGRWTVGPHHANHQLLCRFDNEEAEMNGVNVKGVLGLPGVWLRVGDGIDGISSIGDCHCELADLPRPVIGHIYGISRRTQKCCS